MEQRGTREGTKDLVHVLAAVSVEQNRKGRGGDTVLGGVDVVRPAEGKGVVADHTNIGLPAGGGGLQEELLSEIGELGEGGAFLECGLTSGDQGGGGLVADGLFGDLPTGLDVGGGGGDEELLGADTFGFGVAGFFKVLRHGLFEGDGVLGFTGEFETSVALAELVIGFAESGHEKVSWSGKEHFACAFVEISLENV